jgi:hypothetical protein
MARLKASVQKGCSITGSGARWATVGLTRRRGVAEKDAERKHRRTSKPESAESAEICGASRGLRGVPELSGAGAGVLLNLVEHG